MRRQLISLVTLALAAAAGAVVVENTAGKLEINATDHSITSLAVTGTMDARDFKFIADSLTELTELDLSQVQIVAYQDSLKPLVGTFFSFPADELPASMLMGTGLTSITLPDSLKSIGQAALAGCTDLTAITLPEGLTTIGSYAFSGSGLTEDGRRFVNACWKRGVAVDLSHASEKTFWDVLRIAKRPVICSHSNAKSICDHPRNLTDDMFRAIRAIVDETPDVKVIYPIHMNPVVRAAAEAELGGCDRIRIIEPLDVLDFHNFMARSYMILTDSGGIQEEAPSLGKPVLVMRDTPERPEGIAAGTLKLVGTDEATIYEEFSRLITDPSAYEAMSRASNPYGDGHASERIADILSGRTPRD